MKTGGCACGAVRYEVTGATTKVTYCHCSKCRRWHGHVGAWIGVERAGFRLVEQHGLKWHAVNPTVRRGFCAECGSSLFWDEEGGLGEKHLGVCAGTIDAPTGLESKAHIYVASKGDYYQLPDDGLLRYEEFK
jgi:hypothetical protein